MPIVASNSKETFEIGRRTFLLNGKPFVVKAAELHYARIPKAYWEHRIQMCKALGMNTICLYVFWNFHEQQENKFDFTGDKNIAEFCRLAQKNGMYIILFIQIHTANNSVLIFFISSTPSSTTKP